MKPRVSIIIAVLNEEEYIAPCLDSLFCQDYEGEIEVIVVDGGSTDKTRQIVDDYRNKHNNLLVLENPGKIVSAGRNIGIKTAKYEFIAYIDGHSFADERWLNELVDAYSRMNVSGDKIGGVGSVYHSANPSLFTVACDSAFRSIVLAAGPDHFLNKTELCEVDHAHYWLYLKDAVIEAGMYDEKMSTAEDIELSLRLRKAGYKLFVQPKAVVYYYRPDNLGKLSKQQFRYGYWRPVEMLKSGEISLKVFIPAFLASVFFFLFIFALFSPIALISLLYLLGVYFVGVLFFAVSLSLRNRCSMLQLLIVIPAVHFSYGAGSLFSLFEMIFGKKHA